MGLVGGLIEIMLYAEYSKFPMNLVPVPEWLDKDIQNMKDTFVRVIKDPGNVLESVGQGMFDAADEKGIAYSAGYVTMDVVIAILTDKGLDKLKSTGKAGKTTANVADNVTDAVEDAARAGKEAREAAQNAGTVAEGLEGKAGKVLEGGSKTPSEIARSWQGTGKYPGIDDYVDVTVEKGTVLYRGEPNGTEYFTTLDAIEQSLRDATKLFEGLPQYYVPDVQDLIDKGILTPVDNIKLNK